MDDEGFPGTPFGALGSFRRVPAGLALGSSLLPPRSRRAPVVLYAASAALALGPPPCVLPHSLPQTSSARAGCREAQIQLPEGLQWLPPQHSPGLAPLPAGGFSLLLGRFRTFLGPRLGPSSTATASSALKLVKGFKKPGISPFRLWLCFLGSRQ